MVLVGGGDYSLAPKRTAYPSELLQAWQRKYPHVRLLFSPPGQYLDALKKEIREGQAKLPDYAGDTVYSYNAFWMNMPEIKLRYRRAEHLLGASEMLATAANLKARAPYPSEQFYNSWIMMLMNMDRNTLWGAGAGDPFYSPSHWNVQDRFRYVEEHSSEAVASALQSLTEEGRGISLFNRLSWERKDPIQIVVPEHTRLAELVCQPHEDGLLCAPRQPSMGISSLKLESGDVPALAAAAFRETVETPLYLLQLNRETGAIVSLRDKASGKEYLGGPANVILAESVAGVEDDPANWMPPRPKRKMIDSSSRHSCEWQVWRGPVATTLVARSGFVGTSGLERRITLYNDFPRIDFDTTIDLHSPDLVVTADFPLAGPIVERTRGIPYGFSSGDPHQVNRPLDYFLMGDHKLYGFSDALAPAVRWSDYGFGAGGGLALLDRGLPCHELNGDTVTLALLNAQSTYRKLANTILAGQGRSKFSYAIWPHAGTWQQFGIPQRAWEYNSPIIAQLGRVAARQQSFLKTSPNIIVEAVRRVGNDIEIRLVECLGAAGKADISLNLPHQDARITNLMGEQGHSLSGNGTTYRFPVRPQQIVTLRFRAASSVATPPAIRAWDPLVPSEKRAALHQHLNLQGYPGGEPN
jgi:alpha-mannosidase